MKLEGIVGKKIEINKKISDYVKANIDLGKEKNEMALEKLNFIEETLTDLIENFQTFKEGNEMYIHSCMNFSLIL